MTKRYSRRESEKAKKDAGQFGAAYPALAPQLMRKHPDPDTELLFDAFIYLAWQLFLILKKSFADLAESLLCLIAPQDLQEIPAATILAFTLDGAQEQTLRLAAGTLASAAPVEGVRCLFSTAEDLEVHPLELTDACHTPLAENTGRITLTFESRIPLEDWTPRSLSLFLPGDHASAADLYMNLRHTTRITLQPLDEESPAATLPAACLIPCGFEDNDGGLPWPGHTHPAGRLLQEYFSHESRFLMFRLTGWEKWPNRGKGKKFAVSFEIGSSPAAPPRVTRESFAINTVCAVNAFPHTTRPIIVDHRKDAYLLRPEGPHPEHTTLLAVKSVTGYAPKTQTIRQWQAFEHFGFQNGQPVYYVTRKGAQDFLSLCYPKDLPLAENEVLSIDLTCSNGDLAQTLRAGDIRLPTPATPPGVHFRNITAVTPRTLPPSREGAASRLCAHIIENQQSLEETLRAHLERYAGDKPDHLKRIAGIESITVSPATESISGIDVAGREIRLKVRQDHFASAGDLYLFGSIIERFLAKNTAINTFARLVIEETTRGETFRWPVRFLKPVLRQETYSLPETFSNDDFQGGDALETLHADLIARGCSFAIAAAERVIGRLKKPVYLRPEHSMAFPPADIARIAPHKDGYRIELTFFRLLDCLPTHYAESVTDELLSTDSTVTRDFLNIFQAIFYDAHRAVWRKYRLPERIAADQSAPYMEKLLCLAGFGLAKHLPETGSLPRHASVFKQPRSAAGLQTFLRCAMGIPCIDVEEFILRHADIPDDQRLRADGTKRLGIDSVVGSYVPTRDGAFRVHIGPLSWVGFESFNQFDGPNYLRLAWLVSLYMNEPVVYDMKLWIGVGEALPMICGNTNGPRVGHGSWMVSEPNKVPLSQIIPMPAWMPFPQWPEPEPAEPARTFADVYQTEMADQQKHFDDFVEDHPNMKPMIDGRMADPGVERLREAAAFCGTKLQMKIQDDFPEIIHPVMEALAPWTLKPIPATSIVAFHPTPNLTQPVLVNALAQIESLPVDGTKCRFRTCFDITVHPLTLKHAAWLEPSGQGPVIKLDLELNRMTLSNWGASALRLFLSGDHDEACNLYLLLMRYLQKIIIKTADDALELPAENLKPFGFGHGQTLLAPENRHLPGHLLMQEYFLFPDKYLFLDLTGLESCRTLGDASAFAIELELQPKPPFKPVINKNSFALNATPVINLFEHKGTPLVFTPYDKEQKVSVFTKQTGHYRIYSVDEVCEFYRDSSGNKKTYRRRQSALMGRADVVCYDILLRQSYDSDGHDPYLALSDVSEDKTKLDIDLTCTNGYLPERLGLGDINVRISAIPASVRPANIKPVTCGVNPAMQPNRLWRLLSNMNLNRASLGDAGGLRAILREYAIANDRHYQALQANLKRIDGIASITTNPVDRLTGGTMNRGYEINIKLDRGHFTGPGDLYLFASLVERFLGGYVSERCFVRVFVEDTDQVNRFEWPMRFGDGKLI